MSLNLGLHLQKADLCFVAAPWKEFATLGKNDFISLMKTPVIFDAWSLFNFEFEKDIDYRQIGKH